ncbi:SufE family protein [Demetria terragena]|uniref:SufE family protein n=1 Tax=Demetria terragena TaxID=63959 RepID=UPI00037CFD16|nr:SufE family protein [Demetria terragena]
MSDLPAPLAEVIDDFQALSEPDRLQLLLEMSDELPDLPPRFDDVEMEQVHECQSPLFLAAELERDPSGDEVVRLFFKAPREAPTTRGFAGILHAGLDGQSATAVLAVPDDVPFRIGLSQAVSPLRMRGMVAMLARIKRQIRDMSPGSVNAPRPT